MAGSLSTTISVGLVADSIVELDEQFVLNLSNLRADNRDVTLVNQQAIGTIRDDDEATITLTPVTNKIKEGTNDSTTKFTFSVDLSHEVQGGFQLDYTTNDDTATLAHNDYIDNDGTLNFSGGAESQIITVEVNHDAIVEADELFQVVLGAIRGLDDNIDPARVHIENGIQTGTIFNDDTATISFQPIDDSRSEDENGDFEFEVAIDLAVAGGFTLDFFTNDATATADDGDYINHDGELQFTETPNETFTIRVRANPDSKVELDEQFEVVLGALSQLTAGISLNSIIVPTNPLMGQIRNDDAATISINDIVQNEGDTGLTAFTFTVTLDADVDTQVQFDFATRDGKAKSGSDYTCNQGSRQVGASAGDQTQITVFVSGDLIEELDESFFMDLLNLTTSGRDVTIADDTGEGIIRNEDHLLVVATGPGKSSVVTAMDGISGQTSFEFSPYGENFLGGVRVATGDVNGDGTPDIITAAGPGGGPHVKVFDGSDGSTELLSFFAFDATFSGGVFVASADLDGDNIADIITGADAGGGPHVKVISGADGTTELFSFFAYGAEFTGGVRVAAGDITGDGTPDIITGAGPGGGPHVR
ncbi:MAG: VCBS repeat-containing protein, partial [Planctomycetaceae bacterium]|nr:VCBS repeat-containing protein [Planctomycetaceae bacterium]